MSDGVAIASLAATAATSAVAIITTGRIARADRRERRALAQLTLVAEPYVEILGVVEEIGVWCTTTQPPITAPGLPSSTELPAEQRQMRMAALVAAYANDSVREHFRAWRGVVDRVYRADLTIRLADQPGQPEAVTARQELDVRLRQWELERRQGLQRAIRTELSRTETRRWRRHASLKVRPSPPASTPADF